jgi:hypothetical protein
MLRFVLDQAQDVAFAILGKRSPSDPRNVVLIHKCHATQFSGCAKCGIDVSDRKITDVCVDEAVELRLARINTDLWREATDDFLSVSKYVGRRIAWS